MPTVQVQQSLCASEVDVFYKSCRCQNVPSLTARVSRLRLYDENVFSSRGFSTITIPPKHYSPAKKTNNSPPSSATSTTSTTEKNVQNSSKINGTPKLHNETAKSYTISAYRQEKGSTLCEKIQINKNGDSEIIKRLSNIYVSERNIDYKHVFEQKKDRRGGSTKTSLKKRIENSRSLESFISNKNEVLEDIKSPCKAVERLHPGWRRVPWKPHFGWTDSHQEMCKLLRQEVENGKVESIYYNTEEDHAAAHALLSGPSVSTVADILEVIRKITYSRSPWLYKVTRKSRKSSQTFPYDADDEDSV